MIDEEWPPKDPDFNYSEAYGSLALTGRWPRWPTEVRLHDRRTILPEVSHGATLHLLAARCTLLQVWSEAMMRVRCDREGCVAEADAEWVCRDSTQGIEYWPPDGWTVEFVQVDSARHYCPTHGGLEN